MHVNKRALGVGNRSCLICPVRQDYCISVGHSLPYHTVPLLLLVGTLFVSHLYVAVRRCAHATTWRIPRRWPVPFRLASTWRLSRTGCRSRTPSGRRRMWCLEGAGSRRGDEPSPSKHGGAMMIETCRTRHRTLLKSRQRYDRGKGLLTKKHPNCARGGRDLSPAQRQNRLLGFPMGCTCTAGAGNGVL